MFHVDVIGLVVSLLFFYVIYLIMEIAFIQQKAKTKN